MKVFAAVILSCLLATVSCLEFPGFPGVDCQTTRQYMSLNPHNHWMMPKCKDDGTFQELQCYNHPPFVPNTCICVDSEGNPLTLAGVGSYVKTCDCPLAQHRILKNGHIFELPRCEKDGSFSKLQCSGGSKQCWCVDKQNNILVKPSKDIESCD